MRLPDPEKEKLIRQRALEMVVTDGLDRFSMQKLAKAVKVSPSTLYVYFADRDDLIFQLFRSGMAELSRHIMDGLKPDMTFAEGLEIQWRNRMRYALGYPLQSDFLEQIKHSPYHQPFVERISPEFFEAMRRFVRGSIERGEVREIPVEVYWALAFAPLYQLIKLHRSGFGVPALPGESRRPPFRLTEEVMKTALEIVIRGLAPDPSPKRGR